MARQGINTGTSPNSGTGDTLLDGGVKINDNFIEVYGLLGDGTNLAPGIVTSIQAGDNISVSAATGQVTITGSANTSAVLANTLTVLGISTLGSSNGIGTVTVGIGTTALLVDGSARVTGVLTVGQDSITIDGRDATGPFIHIGSGVTITSTEIQVGDQRISGSGNTVGVLSASQFFTTGIVTANSFRGDGSFLTGITASGVGITVMDNGGFIGVANSINFGANLSVSAVTAGLVTVTASAGSASTENIITDSLQVLGVTTATNQVEIRSDDATPGRVDYYCEVSNAHFTRLQAAPHAEYSGNPTVVLPTVAGDMLVGDTASAISQNVNTTGIITAATVSATSLSRAREDKTTTSASVSSGSTITIDFADGYKSYALLNVGITSAAWLRLYTDAAARTADETRVQGTDPAPDAGVIAEVISIANTSVRMSPGVIGWNNDSTPGNTIYMRLSNTGVTDAGAGIGITLTLLKLED